MDDDDRHLLADMLRQRHPSLRALMVAALDAAQSSTNPEPIYTALLTALRADAQWECRHLHPWLEARDPGSSLPLARAVAAQLSTAASIELDLRTDAAATGPEWPPARQRAVRLVARLVGQQLLHLDAREQVNPEAAARAPDLCTAPTPRTLETDR